jgi:hypothetical protein
MLTQLQTGELLRTLKNPRYAEPIENSPILLDGEFNGYTIPFIASPYDMMDYGRNIYQRAIDGDFGPIKDFDPNNTMLKVSTIFNDITKERPHKKSETLDLFAEKKE